MKRIIFKLFAFALLVAATAATWSACRDELEGKTFLTSDEVMMDDYITRNDVSMSAFLDIADRAEFRGMLHAYGIYTCFVPTNEAIDAYLQSLGKSSVADLSPEECANIVKYHVVRHTGEGEDVVAFTSSEFIDGRLGNTNLMLKYLTTRTVQLDGKTVIQVNREANVVEKDIYVANGYIHKIDKVLTPPEKTCGAQVEALPEEYSLFMQVMQETGWADSLKLEEEGLWYSVFLHSDEAFRTVGISTMEDLRNYLKNNAKYTDKSDEELLNIYAAYHCVKGLYYIADLSKVSALQSQAPNQAITLKLKRDTLLVNEYGNSAEPNTYEAGVPIDKKSEYTDYSCSNGVLVNVGGYIGPKIRGAQALYWDVAEQPELVSNSKFRKSGFSISWDEAQNWSEMKFTLASGVKTYGEFAYSYWSSYANNFQLVNQDALQLRPYRLASFEFTLPLLTPGTYNVWVAFRSAVLENCKVRATLVQEGQDDQAMGTVMFGEYNKPDEAAEVLLPAGYKRYVAKERINTMNCMQWGTCMVQSTGRHKLRCDVVDRGRNSDFWLDMIMFIPVEDDQLWPRFDMKGKAIYADTPCEEIWPYANACSSDNASR